MVTMATERRAIDEREAAVEFNGRWVLLDKRDFPPSEDMGYIIAYGDGTPEDRDALMKIKGDMFNGRARLMKGYAPENDTPWNSGIQEFAGGIEEYRTQAEIDEILSKVPKL